MKNLAADIENGQFKNVYLLYGEEDYLKRNYKAQLLQAISGGDTMNVNSYEGKSINIREVIDIAETMPFLSQYRLILMEDTDTFKSGGEELADYLKDVPETTVFLLVESNVDKRSKMYKAVKALCKPSPKDNIGVRAYICELKHQIEKDLQVWAARLIAKDNKKITKDDMAYLLAKVGTDMQMLSTEIEKLISYAGNKQIIDKEDIDAVCITQLSVRIFDMIDAISVKNQKKTLDSYYELLASKEPPMRILFMIARQFNLMLQAKDFSARRMSREEVAKAMGVQSFIAGKSIKQSKNFTTKELKSGLAESVDTEEMIKSGKMDEKIGVEMLLVKYSKKEERSLN